MRSKINSASVSKGKAISKKPQPRGGEKDVRGGSCYYKTSKKWFLNF